MHRGRKQTRTHRRRRYKTDRRTRTKHWRLRRGGMIDTTPITPVAPERRQHMELFTSPEKRTQRLASLLNVACADSDFCIEIGAYEDEINQLFNNFTNFSMVDMKNITRIGERSTNGAVLRVPFAAHTTTTDAHHPYIAYTVMKFAQQEMSDNLGYEGWVGEQLINTVCSRIPHFVRTYGVYRITNSPVSMQNHFQTLSNGKANTSIFSSYVRVPPDKLIAPNVCKNPMRLVLMLQHFKHFYPLHSLLTNQIGSGFSSHWVRANINSALFQVYYTLNCLKDRFTHYDLNTFNVALYCPFGDPLHFIEMHYHVKDPLGSGTEIELVFPTSYLVKIIDYGRAYANLLSTPSVVKRPTTTRTVSSAPPTNTAEYVKQICAEKSCLYSCGDVKGFYVINGQNATAQSKMRYVNPTLRNRSADLRLLHIVGCNFHHLPHDVQIEFDKQGIYATPENMQVGYVFPATKHQPVTLYNVMDAYHMYLDIVMGNPNAPRPYNLAQSSGGTQTLRDEYMELYYGSGSKFKKRGIMHVYESGDRNYTFEVLDEVTGHISMHATRSSMTAAKQKSQTPAVNARKVATCSIF